MQRVAAGISRRGRKPNRFATQDEGEILMLRMLALVAGVLLLPNAAAAAEWPAKPVRVIVPFAAGGAADTTGRVYSDALGAAFGKQFFVENRPGSGGLIAAEAVAQMEPDGYTLLVSG